MRAKLRESQELTDKTGNGFPHQIWKVDSPRQPADDLIPFGTQFDGAGRRFWVGSNYWLVSLVGSRYQSTVFTWLEALKEAHGKIDTCIISVYILNSKSVGLKGTRMTIKSILMTLEHTNKSNGVFVMIYLGQILRKGNEEMISGIWRMSKICWHYQRDNDNDWSYPHFLETKQHKNGWKKL